MKWLVIVIVTATMTLYGVASGFAGQEKRQDLQALIELVAAHTGDLYVLDIRPKSDYLRGSLPGAISVPSDPVGFIADGRGGPVLLIAGADVAPASLANWYRRLEGFGFSPIHQIEGGFKAWVAAGGPVQKPADVYVKPGTLPFIIPRGICELNTPALVYD